MSTGLRPAAMLALALGAGCVSGTGTTTPAELSPVDEGGVTIIRPRCARAKSCLVGHVVAAETAVPLARAAVFLERDLDDALDNKPLRITTITDDVGVFTVFDAPAGRYRIAVYKNARRYEARGLVLGGPGVPVVLVRLPRV